MPLTAMPSSFPQWKKKKPSTFKELSPSDRDYLVDVLQTTAPTLSEDPDQIQQHQGEPVSEYQDEAELAHPSRRPTLNKPTSTQPTPPLPPASAPIEPEPILPKPPFKSFLHLAKQTLKSWSRRSTLIPNSTKAKLASTFSLEFNSYMKEYAAKTRAVFDSSSARGHIHRIVEQCVLARRNLRDIGDLLQGLDGDDVVDGVVRGLMEDTGRVLGNLECDDWIEVGYALRNQ